MRQGLKARSIVFNDEVNHYVKEIRKLMMTLMRKITGIDNSFGKENICIWLRMHVGWHDNFHKEFDLRR